ncbi:hypothetical protein HF086_016078 [Spodoptera exigua]|uniref:Sushi domain-containing protein n=1 Tax=Spodoptera exigua TaxID=7107 RepID=A0A922SAX1_SPOEX|nr:hypothetical protein HF086_016078 [Spodoptera exigua]
MNLKSYATGSCQATLQSPLDHGTYVVSNAPYAVPGQGFQALQLTVTCRPGYGVLGTDIVFCQDGTWSNDIPKCVRYCKLDPHPSVHYHCLVSGTVEGQRKCNTYEPTGTVVRPECNSPNYYSTGILPFMRCIDGSWDYVAVCTPGLPKNGKNITILIKDTIEVYVHDFVYGSGQSSQPDKIKIDLVTKKDSVNVNEVDSTASPMDYEISEDDWRMGAPQRPETKRKDTGLNPPIVSGMTSVNSNRQVCMLSPSARYTVRGLTKEIPMHKNLM